MAKSPSHSQRPPLSQSSVSPVDPPPGYKSIDDQIAELKAQAQHPTSPSFLNVPIEPSPPIYPRGNEYSEKMLAAMSRHSGMLQQPTSQASEASRTSSNHNKIPINGRADPDSIQANKETQSLSLPEGQSRLEVQDMAIGVDVPTSAHSSRNGRDSLDQSSESSSNREDASSFAALLFPNDLGEAEYVVPLNLTPTARDQYVNTINYYRKHVTSLMEKAHPDPETIQKVRQMLEQANNDTTHLDLSQASDDPSQELADPITEASWAVNNSQKFKFLQEFFDALNHIGIGCHIALIAQPGKLVDITERFLEGLMVSYKRPGTHGRSGPNSRGCFEVSLLASDFAQENVSLRQADVVIALDNTFKSTDHYARSIRRRAASTEPPLAPVLHLVVHNAAEHIQHCVPHDISEIPRLRMVVGYISSLEKEVGIPGPSDMPIKRQAGAVAKYIHAYLATNEWPLPSIRPIEEIDFYHPPPESREEGIHGSVLASRNLKRSFVSDADTSASPKRQRVTPAREMAYISDSAASHSQRTISSLTQSLESAKSDIFHHSQRADKAMHDLDTMQKSLEEHILALSVLQHRYESHTRAIAKMRDTNKELTSSLDGAKLKIQALTADRDLQRESRGKVEAEMRSAQVLLSSSTNPSIKEIAEHQAARLAAEAQVQKLQKKYDLATKDLDFTRQQYQTASTSAVELSTNVTTLETEIADLKIRADNRAVMLLEKNKANSAIQYKIQIQALERQLAQRDSMLKRKEEELRELGRRGRGMQTRGTSVTPVSAGRSPKANPSSRGVSPAAESSSAGGRFLAAPGQGAVPDRPSSGRGRGRGGANATSVKAESPAVVAAGVGTGSGRNTPVSGHRRQISGNGNGRGPGGVPMTRTGSGLRRQIAGSDAG